MSMGKNKTDHFQIDLEDLDDLRKKVKDLQALLKGKPVKALINNAAISPKNEKNNRLNI